MSGINLQLGSDTEITDSAIDKINLVWKILCMGSTDLISIESDDNYNPPTWKSFHSQLINDTEVATIIGYGPIVSESPTNPNVVAKSIEYCMSVSNKIGQEHTIMTCDQAIYEIALALVNKHPAKYEKLILRMGGFHIATNFWEL